jgi:TatD DNase family protein
MGLIDTHSHIYLAGGQQDWQGFVQRAKNAGVTAIMVPCVDAASAETVQQLAQLFPGYCLPMLGLHPTYVGPGWQNQLEAIEKAARACRPSAVGEIGIDLYWDKTYLKEQQQAFSRQLALAAELDLPVNIHVREAFSETFSIIEGSGIAKLRGVMHCFSGGTADAEKAINLGLALGIGGVVTFKKSPLAAVVQAIGLQHMVLETDSPYLAPAPHRGKPNESSLLRHIADKIAEIKSCSPQEVEAFTTENCIRIFGQIFPGTNN